MARKKYTPKKLEKAFFEEFLPSVARTVVLTERKATGRKDYYGHDVYEDVPIKNDRGDVMTSMEFPGGLTKEMMYSALGISSSTWSNYQNDENYREVTDQINAVFTGYLNRRLETSDGKAAQGLIFILKSCYGQTDKIEVKATTVGMTLEEYLAQHD